MNLFKKIINIGIDDAVSEFDARRIRLANLLTLSPLFIYVLFACIGIVYKLPLVVIITIIVSFINLSGLWFSSRKKYMLARSVPLVFNSVLIFIVSDIFDFGPHFYLFYFPILTAYASYYRFKEERANIIASFCVTAVAVTLCIFLPAHTIYQITTSETLIITISYLVKLLSFLLFLVFIIMIINFNVSVEDILKETLQQAKKQADELITANQKAEQAAEAKGRFLSNMSHELRTPLNGIIGSVNLLLQGNTMPDQKQNFDVLKYSSEHMLNLVNEVLDFSKLDADKIELNDSSCNLKELCIETSKIFTQQLTDKKILFECIIDDDLNRNFFTDKTRLKQILCNLIGNACKFTTDGKVVLSAQKISGSTGVTGVLFSVKDTGIGIPKEKHRHIFESFSQIDTSTSRKYGGTGLGLSISSKLVKMLGGTLAIESEPGKGSDFYFTLYFEPDTVTRSLPKERTAGDLFPLTNLQVLVAEDNPVNMMIAKKFLEKWDVSVTCAANGSEAIELFDKNNFDVLLIDLEMPGIDGYKAVGQIRLKNKTVPAIAFTAAVFENINVHLLEKGFTGYLQKPFRPEEMHRKLAVYYHNKINSVS
jgi:signal transduction histidine kinase